MNTKRKQLLIKLLKEYKSSRANLCQTDQKSVKLQDAVKMIKHIQKMSHLIDWEDVNTNTRHQMQYSYGPEALNSIKILLKRSNVQVKDVQELATKTASNKHYPMTELQFLDAIKIYHKIATT